eukprot:4252260-Amphidinium_carterae.1
MRSVASLALATAQTKTVSSCQFTETWQFLRIMPLVSISPLRPTFYRSFASDTWYFLWEAEAFQHGCPAAQEASGDEHNSYM